MTTPPGEDRDAPERPEPVSSEPRHEYGAFRTRHDRVRIPGDPETQGYDIIESADAVTVVAVTREGELVMVEQFRYGTRTVELEFPGGVIDAGEAPLVCGVRELREETGYEGEDPELLGTIGLNPAWQSTMVHVVRIRNAERRAGKDLDDGEETRVRLLLTEEVVRRTADGGMPNSVAIAALALHRWKPLR